MPRRTVVWDWYQIIPPCALPKISKKNVWTVRICTDVKFTLIYIYYSACIFNWKLCHFFSNCCFIPVQQETFRVQQRDAKIITWCLQGLRLWYWYMLTKKTNRKPTVYLKNTIKSLNLTYDLSKLVMNLLNNYNESKHWCY